MKTRRVVLVYYTLIFREIKTDEKISRERRQI